MADGIVISGAAAANFIEAATFANHIGLPLNQLLSINWMLADGDDDIPYRFAKFRERASKWLGRRAVPLTCCWVLEAPRGYWNSHMGIHLPRKLVKEFSVMLPDWVGGNDVPGLIDIKPITSNGWRLYVLKGIDPAEARRYGIRPVPQGQITAKRCGTSENIGRSARKRWEVRYAAAEPVAA